MSADAVESLKRKHAEELQGLRAQAVQAQELEAELAKAREVESSLRLEFDRQLAEEKRILSAEFDSKVNELRTTLGSEVESRGAQIDKLETLRRLDSERHDNEIRVGVPTTARFSLACWGWRKLFVVYFLSCFSSLALSCRLLTL
jgi:hypothetical protein